MPDLPIRPHFKSHGRTVRARDEAIEFNRMAQRVANHVHALILTTPQKVQFFTYDNIARPLGLQAEQVRAAIGRGDYNGISFAVDPLDREALACLIDVSGHPQ